jgi:hypothetical protein
MVFRQKRRCLLASAVGLVRLALVYALDSQVPGLSVLGIADGSGLVVIGTLCHEILKHTHGD